MITLTVHNIDDAIKDQLEINARQHNCSVEEEVCRILKQALFSTKPQKNQVAICTSKSWNSLTA
jgi:plasmid stability protein